MAPRASCRVTRWAACIWGPESHLRPRPFGNECGMRAGAASGCPVGNPTQESNAGHIGRVPKHLTGGISRGAEASVLNVEEKLRDEERFPCGAVEKPTDSRSARSLCYPRLTPILQAIGPAVAPAHPANPPRAGANDCFYESHLRRLRPKQDPRPPTGAADFVFFVERGEKPAVDTSSAVSV